MKRAIVVLVLVIASGSLLPSSKRVIPGGSVKLTGEDPHLPPPFRAVAHFLDLSPDQLQALLQLRQETQPALAEARRQVGELQVMLKRTLDEEVADAEELGNLLLSLQAARQNVGHLHKSFVESFRETLGEEQRHKLHSVFRAARMQKILPVFKLVGLLP
jgi:hypothetical protein